MDIWLKPKKGKREKGGNTKKYGRNRLKCQWYRRTGQREKNKVRRAARIARKLARRAERRRVVEGTDIFPTSRSRT